MYLDLLEILKCPECGGRLRLRETLEKDGEEIVNAVIGCDCGHKYKVMDGVVNFGSQEQEFSNNWSSSYEAMKYEELDKYVEENTPQSLKALNKKAKTYIIDNLNKSKPELVLDVASGRGMLATYIAEYINYSPTLILTDLSFLVLKYDRLKMKKTNPGLKVNYIACDCTHMPIIDNAVDRVVSFYGITNMMDFAKDGIKESCRVLKQGGKFLNSVFYVDCSTAAAREIEKAFKEQLKVNVFDEILSEKELLQTHKSTGFQEISAEIIGEGVGEENKLDAIPIEGEWFALAVINGTK